MATRTNSSPLWHYFQKAENYKAICNFCQEPLSFKSTTANLRSHIRRKHKSAFQFLIARDPTVVKSSDSEPQKKAKIEPQPLLNTFGNFLDIEPVAETSSTVADTTPKRASQVTTPVNKTINTEQKNRIDSDLMDMFIDGLHPFSLVEERSFKKLLRWIPGYKLPSKKTVTGHLLENIYAKTEQSVKSLVSQEVKRVCITTDLWTNSATDSYIAVTGHYVTSDFELKSLSLGCCQFRGIETDDNIAIELSNLIKQWGLYNKVNFAVSSSDQNISSALREVLSWEQFDCYIHTLNLVVVDALSLFEDTLEKVKQIVGHFKKNAVSSEELVNCQVQLGKEPQRLKQQVDNKWISTYLMLKRFVELEEAVRATLNVINEDLPIISVEEWDAFSQLCQVLKPFEVVISDMSGEKYLAGSLVIVITGCLKEYCNRMLNKDNLSPMIHNITLSLKLFLEERFQNIEHNMAFAMCTFMDPRFKMHAFLDQTAAKKTKEHIEKLVAEIIEQSTHSEQNMAKTTKVSEVEDELNPWIIFDRIASKDTEKENTSLSKAVKEVEMYLADERLPRKNELGEWNCRFQWWKSHRHVYPNLTRLFLENCNIVATSVPCNQFFSKTGNIVANRRTSLTSKKVEKLVFLKTNLNEDRFKILK